MDDAGALSGAGFVSAFCDLKPLGTSHIFGVLHFNVWRVECSVAGHSLLSSGQDVIQI
ncbi:protein of unknown function [Bradyrhizobium vignae]|uniref:Uncharacterized protein n=1 Tax=Bradyrhizobium vignae TaxID=1549949 RepID=A0A2U3QB14_9BRAD|nr:protein of unknown function [Bradyrhizobium vignae]